MVERVDFRQVLPRTFYIPEKMISGITLDSRAVANSHPGLHNRRQITSKSIDTEVFKSTGGSSD